MRLFRHILFAAITLCALGSCINDHYPADGADGMHDQQFVSLLLHVGTATPTRADLPSPELMHSLRIVLINAVDNTVEQNLYIDDRDNADIFNNSAGVNEIDYSKVRVIRTMPGPKRIYLIANEASTTSVNGSASTTLSGLLNSFGSGSKGFEEMVNSIYFTSDFSNNLVLSSNYDFDVVRTEETVEKEFWLVHAATKFEFRFENYCTNDIVIDQLTVSQTADRMYLMANLDDKEKTKKIEGKDFYWIDWLKIVCDDTTSNPDLPDNKDINEKYGWIADYALPERTDHSELDIKAALGSEQEWTIRTGGKTTALALPQVYSTESKYPVNAGAEPSAQQSYTFTVKLRNSTTGDERTFADRPLENLRALFRNTHVKVTATVTQDDQDLKLVLQIGVCKWDDEGDVDIPTFD